MKYGRLEVAGGAKRFEYADKEYVEDQRDAIYLCRCGAFKNKPFCGSAHADSGLEAELTVK